MISYQNDRKARLSDSEVRPSDRISHVVGYESDSERIASQRELARPRNRISGVVEGTIAIIIKMDKL
ncbi:hypothetical protein [Dolichospermum circinale]|uniref:hypothetical protein n=1 Tax=Dolichospermum circinale TaxID=109265 RepID=UPI00232BCE2A|nr:hypothetical protein [Dolichospermum circinale]MDB9448627.1 hypothetical protein [Dolichospermum circinale CS-547]